MKKLILLAVVAGLVGCGQPQWLLHGDSHGLDREEWNQASEQKKLGTAGYWLLSLQRKDFLKNDDVTGDLNFEKNATDLKGCLNTTMPYSAKATNHLVADCVNVLGLSK